MPDTRFVAADAKATKRPLTMVLAVHAVLVMVVMQVPRSNTSDWALGLGAVEPRFDAVEVNATKSPSSEMEGFELGPLPAVVPSGVDTRYVVGTHVSLGAVVTMVAMLQVSRM